MQSWRIKMVGHITCTGERRTVYKILFRNSEVRNPFGRPKRRWEDSIRMDLREIWWKGVDWMHLVQDRDKGRTVVNTVMNLRVP
jgi:hypothetical protein